MTVSIPAFIRNPDGTAWEGRIAYRWSFVRENKLKVTFDENSVTSVDDAYALYGVCSALHISQAQSSNFGKLDLVYSFLYGHSLEKLMEVQEEETYSMPGLYRYEPQEWTTQMVATMNWDSFCFAYYTFLCSKNDFESKVWEVLGFILNTLKSSPAILASLLAESGRSFDEVSCSDFWKTVCKGLQSRTLVYLHEKTCYTAFCALTTVRPFFPTEEYRTLQDLCLKFLDEIARSRIEDACKETYTVRELLDLNIDLMFFYEDYFALYPTTRQTEQYVAKAVFMLLHTKGDKIAAAGEMLAADAVYEKALKYAQTVAERELIATKRNRIAVSVAVEASEQEKIQREQEKQWEKEERKDAATDKIAKILGITFLVSVVTTVLFGLLAILGVIKAFSLGALIVSLCILLPLLMILAIEWRKDRHRKR